MSEEITQESVEVPAPLTFEQAAYLEFNKVEAFDGKTLGRVYDWFMAKVKAALDQVNLPPKEDVLVIVSDLYDKFVAPIDLPGPDSLLDPLLKQLCLKGVSRMYDQLVNKRTPDEVAPTV